ARSPGSFTRRAGRPRRERGAALIIGLVLLMVLTVLAASTMRTGSLQLLIAGNAQYGEDAFQIAHAGLDTVIRAGEPAAAPDCTEPPAWSGPVALPEPGGSYRTHTCFRGESSYRVGDSFGPVLNYEVTADAEAGRGARAVLVQG